MINEAFLLHLNSPFIIPTIMRKIFTVLFFVANYGLSAQYTITPLQKPDIGDAYSYISLDTINIINGSSGANQVWNYTNLVLPTAPTVNSILYSNATAVTNYSWYPGSYMAIIGSGGGFTAFDNDPNNYSLNWLKSMVGSATSTKYNDPLTKYHYPLSYGSIFSDSAKFGAYTEQPPSPGFVGSYLSYGVNSYTCTGYGTLNLPNGVSLPNTLKLNIQYIKTYLEETTNNITGQDTTYYEEYFNAISKFPVLAFLKSDGHNTIFNTTTTYHSKDIKLNSVVVAGIKNYKLSASDISISPNPSCKFNIAISSESIPEKPTFSLQNALGQEIETIVNPISETYYTLDLKNNIPGIYFLTIKTQKGQVTKKLLVQ